MKSKFLFLLVATVATGIFSCSDDNEVNRKGDPDIAHEGEKWTIAAMTYTLIEQGVSGSSINQTFKEGTETNAGHFYFVSGGEKGSFELNVEGYNKEDFFSYSMEADNSVSIITIDQTVGVTTNQNVVSIQGISTGTEMTLSGTIVKQSLTGQFMLEMEASLVKE